MDTHTKPSSLPIPGFAWGFLTKHFPQIAPFKARPSARRSSKVRTVGGFVHVDRPSERRRIVLSHRQGLYVPDMVDEFDFFFSAVKSKLSDDGFATVDYSCQADHEVVGFDDFPVRFTTMSEPMSTTDQYLNLSGLSSGQTVLDLGCYCGLTSIVFSKIVGETGRVIAIDADSDNLANARVNLDRYRQASGFQNIDLRWAAVSPKGDDVSFSTEGTMGSAPVQVVGGRRGAVKTVPGVTLDRLAAEAGRKIDFVKMDIEGSEIGVLESASNLIASHRPVFVIEPHYVKGEPTHPQLIRALERHGYRCRLEPQSGVEDLYLPLVVGLPDSPDHP